MVYSSFVLSFVCDPHPSKGTEARAGEIASCLISKRRFLIVSIVVSVQPTHC